MNRSMKQMLSMLLVVAMMAAMLVIPSASATGSDSVYTLKADAVTVKVDETADVKVNVVYGVNNDTYTLAADTTYEVTGDAKAEVVTYSLANDTLTITVKGVAAGTAALNVKIGDVAGTVNVTVEAAEEPSQKPSAQPSTTPSTQPTPKPLPAGTFTADALREALEPGYDASKNYQGITEPYTLNGFTVYPKYSGYNDDGTPKGTYNKLDIRPIGKFGTPVWSDGYTPVNAIRMEGGGNKTAEWTNKANGEWREFVSNVVKFTVDGPAEVKVWFIQKESTNVALYVEKNPVAVVKSDAFTLEAGEAGIATLKVTEAGTYYVGGCDANGEGSKLNLAKIVVTKDAVQPSTQPSTQPSETPEMTVYEIKADAKVSVSVGGKKTVNVTTDPAGGVVYAVSADTSVATVSDTDGKVVVTGVKAGTTTVTLGVEGGKGTAEVAITVTSGYHGGGGGSSSSSGNKPTTSTMSFADVKEGDWFYDFVKKAFDKGLMKGTSETTFEPAANTSRVMVATVLYRLAGEKKSSAKNPFTDVAAGTWYTDAVIWAAEKGIVTGYDETTFGVNDDITREQLAVMLYRYANSPKVDEVAAMADFTDVDAISDWAADAMRWAVKEGIILGRGNGTLDPKGVASRAEVCTMLVRLAEK